ncbi:Rieske (2Fe-2S) domain-containing protein [Arthrobacter crystallopoietes BAB-32]|uniref:Cytochrome bc1 complex Rieske iron-sulfur subunit n=1 Tax=Arthrobacter crystallopoietes BAB-32 TaxID=1246476 RepID=N1UXK7_9MICC|nr:Rieske (2Fe-2S) domain-containing protein [Arthrobacter crystallopoietes BAB-32]
MAGCSPFQDLVGDTSGEPAAVSTEGAPVRVGKLSEVPVGGSASRDVDGKPILIHRPDEETVLAYSAECTHQGCKVAATESEIACPCHNSTFALQDGSVTGGPAPAPLPRFAAAIDGDWITVSV